MFNNKFLDHNSFDFKNSELIKPPFDQPKNKEISLKYTKVVIDSRDRDINLFPTPAKYTITLDSEIEEVLSGEVTCIDVPLSGYIVNNYNNKVNLANVEYILENGNYDPEGLALMLTSVFNSLCTVTYDKIIDKLKWNGAGQITFDTDSISSATARLLGFNPGSKIELPTTSPNRINLNVNNYIVMTIEAFSINMSSNNILDRTTALLAPNVSMLTFFSIHNLIKKYFNPIIPKLDKIRVSFTDYYGNPYDFQNHDHRIEILFESRKQLGRYMHFV